MRSEALPRLFPLVMLEFKLVTVDCQHARCQRDCRVLCVSAPNSRIKSMGFLKKLSLVRLLSITSA